MAIGQVTASGGIQQLTITDRSGEIRSQIGQGVGQAIGDLAGAFSGYANSQLDMELQWKQRADATENLEVNDASLKFEQRMAEEYTRQARERSADPYGFTNSYDSFYEQEAKKFVQTLPPRVQREMESKIGQHRAQQRASAFAYELSAMDMRDKTTLESSLNTIGTALKAGQLPFEDATVAWAETVDKSALPPADKEALKLQGRQTLESLQFSAEVEMVSKGYGTNGKPEDGSDVVAAGLAPQERGLLNAIASKEASGYDVLNGGERFEGYADHPRRKGAGGTSTAAGRYQFIASTWDAARASYERTYGQKVPDFSPEWQDRVAIHWAEVVYNRSNKHGLTFRQALMSGDPKMIATLRSTLGNPKNVGDPNSVEWQGLGDLYMNDAEFLSVFNGEKGLAGGGTGLATGPDPWADPRFSHIDLEQKLQLGNSAASAVDSYRRESAEATKKAREAELKSLRDLGAQTGNLNYIFTDLRKRPDFNEDMERKYREGVSEFQSKESSSFEVGEALAAGRAISPQQMEGYKNWFGEDRMQAVAGGNADVMSEMLRAASTARIFPPGAKEALRVAMGSPTGRGNALEFMAGVAQQDPALLARSGFTDDEISEAKTFARIAGGFGSQEETMAALDAMRQNAQGIEPGKLKSDGLKLFSESVLPNLSEIIQNDWFDPAMPRPQGETFMLQADASQAFIDGYKIYANEQAATEHMKTVLDRKWGATEVGSSKAIMRLPPENFYPPMQGMFGPSFEYLGTAVRTAYGMQDSDNFFLVPDGATDKEVAAGKLPTYRVWKENALGVMELMPGRWGGDAVTTPAQDESAKKAEAINYDADAIALRTQIDIAREELSRKTLEASEANSVFGKESMEAKKAADAVAKANKEYNDRVDAAKETGYIPPAAYLLQEQMLSQEGKAGVQDLVSKAMEGPTKEAVRARAAYLQREGRKDDGSRYSASDALQEALAERIAKNNNMTKGEAIRLLQPRANEGQ